MKILRCKIRNLDRNFAILHGGRGSVSLSTGGGYGRRRTRWWCRCRTCPRGAAGTRDGPGGRTAETKTTIS